jgi:hypothetical protein
MIPKSDCRFSGKIVLKPAKKPVPRPLTLPQISPSKAGTWRANVVAWVGTPLGAAMT